MRRMSDFDQLAADLEEVVALRNEREGTNAVVEVEPEDTGMQKAIEFCRPSAVQARRAAYTADRGKFLRIAAPLAAMQAGDPERRAETERMLAWATRPDIPAMRQMLMKAVSAGAPVAAVAQMEAKLLRLEAGEDALAKSLQPMQMSDDSEVNRESNRAKPLPSSTDTNAQLRRGHDMLSQLRAEGKISVQDAASFEQRLNRAHDEEAAVQSRDPSRAERMAATKRAGGLLRDLARSGGLDATTAATFEA